MKSATAYPVHQDYRASNAFIAIEKKTKEKLVDTASLNGTSMITDNMSMVVNEMKGV